MIEMVEMVEMVESHLRIKLESLLADEKYWQKQFKNFLTISNNKISSAHPISFF